MMKDKQSSDAANAGRSGGVNLQGTPPSIQGDGVASIPAATTIPPKGTSNGGK